MTYKTLETERLILRGLNPSMMNFIFENHVKSEIMAMLGHRSEQEYEKELFKYKNGYAAYNRSFWLFLLIDRHSDKIIGRAGIHNWNQEHRRGELGYVMVEEAFKRLGLMSEAVSTIIDFGFTEMNLHRLEALVGLNNTASHRILQKNGFEREGILRSHYYMNGKFEDSVILAKFGCE